ncbi:GNAT family N-acetyltransferase, partial [candidate division WOR-3 bacterium]|nr:GNAT family N-acetyltransferase [candidate division WOR-3 bacterium]
VIPLLRRMVEKRPGVAAFRDGRLVGYLAAGVIPEWQGCRTAFAPFWAHAVAEEPRGRTMEDLYVAMSGSWATDGCTTHLISVPASDQQVVDALFRLGHGTAVIDAMRPLTPLQTTVSGVTFRRAGLGDREAWRRLRGGLLEYMTVPPVFMHIPADKPEDYYERWLGDPGHAVWFACRDREPVAYMQLCRLDEEVVVTDERTAGIEGAFTQPPLRNKGIGTALLSRCLEWAKERGFERCAVDFEGENVLGRRFWLRHFEPVLYSLARHIDPRAVSA